MKGFIIELDIATNDKSVWNTELSNEAHQQVVRIFIYHKPVRIHKLKEIHAIL